jgi:2-isopropylmalate synthase
VVHPERTTAGRAARYQPFVPLRLPDRTWPDRTLTAPPRWLSTDLRDGNQALARPMDPRRKLALFDLLVEMGYKEIEVGFPVASQDEHDFVRMLIEQDRIPDDVTITVMVQAREELIRRTAESLAGVDRACLHVYNATAPLFRDIVFGLSRDECRDLAVRGTRWAMRAAEQLEAKGSRISYQYSPELFNETEPEFAVEVCEAVMDLWEPGPDRPIILNFPATVERSQPHVWADQIEWLDRSLSRPEHRCLSVHPHNDRGTGVAATELALLAGARRVEGCLFGGGERAGNVCLVTLGLNLFSHGIDPGIDFHDLDRVRRTVEECTGMPVGPRHPYGGELVYTAFSGAHQDAVKKGFDALAATARETGRPAAELPWRMPYLPIDPADVGRDYEAVVRINSQSGKGGVAYVMSAWHGLDLPRGLQIDFAQVVQAATDRLGREITPDGVRQLFEAEYRSTADPTKPLGARHEPVSTVLYLDGHPDPAAAGSLAAVLGPWGVEVRGTEHVGTPRDPGAPAGSIAVYALCTFEDRAVWGFGLDRDVQSAAFSAVRAAVARAGESVDDPAPAPGPTPGPVPAPVPAAASVAAPRRAESAPQPSGR